MKTTHPVRPLLIVAFGINMASCGTTSCDDKSVVNMVENEMIKHFNTNTDPVFVWKIPKSGLAAMAENNIILLEGNATYNGNNGARKTGRAIARIYCNGIEPMQISMVTVYGLFDKRFVDTKDTALTRSEEEFRIEYLKYQMDSLHRAHQRDSLRRAADSLIRAAGF
ncbi:MAG: hypothetical protein IPM49_14785 [Flavobacteriales bacterium]|nr:hypothetical protein [Flavobacteriales bacterium]